MLHEDTQFSQHYSLKRPFFLQYVLLASLRSCGFAYISSSPLFYWLLLVLCDSTNLWCCYDSSLFWNLCMVRTPAWFLEVVMCPWDHWCAELHLLISIYPTNHEYLNLAMVSEWSFQHWLKVSNNFLTTFSPNFIKDNDSEFSFVSLYLVGHQGQFCFTDSLVASLPFPFTG